MGAAARGSFFLPGAGVGFPGVLGVSPGPTEPAEVTRGWQAADSPARSSAVPWAGPPRRLGEPGARRDGGGETVSRVP